LPKAGRQPFEQVDDKVWFEAWKRRAVEFTHSNLKDDWDWLAIAQHHGLATRLLDWTYNPMLAAYFSISEKSDTDSVIYCYKPYWTVIPENSEPFNREKTALYKPRGVVSRIIRQSGVFTIHHKPSSPLTDTLDENDILERIIVVKKYKNELLFELNQYGVNEYSVFPDLDGLSAYINWHICNRNFWGSKDIFSGNSDQPETEELL
jgi:hypothetical protein